MVDPVPRAISKCPQCGEPVSQFAAGCAICGADLERARLEAAERERNRRLPRPEVPRSVSLGGSGDVLFGAAMALLALVTPPLAILIDGFMALRFHDEGRTGLRNAALVCVAAALLFTAFPFGIWDRVLGALG